MIECGCCGFRETNVPVAPVVMVFLVLWGRWWLSAVSQNSCTALRSLKMPSNEPAVSSRTVEVTV